MRREARTRRTVASVFPHALELRAPWAPRFIVAGDAPLLFDREALERRLRSAEVQRYFDRTGANPDVTALIEGYLRQASVTSILAGFGWSEDLNTDLFPRDEFSRSRVGEPR